MTASGLPADCQLWLALPAALQQDAVDALLGGDLQVSDLLVLEGDTPLALAAPMSAMERVRGRSQRALLMVLTRQEDVPPLLEQVAAALAGASLDWWTTPLLARGRLPGAQP